MCKVVCVVREMRISLSLSTFPVSLAFLPPPRAPRCCLHPWLSVPRKMPPSHRPGKPVDRAVTVHLFPSQILSFGFCLCVHFTCHFARGSQDTQVPGKATHPSAPRSLQKGAHYCAPCYRTSRITGSHPGVGVGVLAPWARAQLACVCPPRAGGRWRRKACLVGGKGEKPLQTNVDLQWPSR